MNAAITEGPVTEELLQRIRSYRVKAPALAASCLEAYGIPGEGPRIAVLDLGGGQALMEALKRLGCAIDVYPAAAIYEEILGGGCAGAVISNGPGDPKEYPGVCDNIKMLMERIPVLGIGLGHQLMALSQGGDTRKMSVGHRGGNHPVKNLETGMILITAQNHGYVVERDSLPKNAGLLYASINDETVEGLRYPMGISVQFLPEQFPDPRDCDALFREFLSMVEGRN